MKYPITQYTKNENGSTSAFKGLNRTERGSGGEWLDENNLDTLHYPCLAPRYTHGAAAALGEVSGTVFAAAEPIDDTGEYEGFTGVVLIADAVLEGGGTEKNFVFMYNGEVVHVGEEPRGGDIKQTVPVRSALWIYDKDRDSVTDDEITGFKENITRIRWSVAVCGSRYVINGYDPELRRGRYFVYDTKADYLGYYSDKEMVRLAVPAEAQKEFTGLTFGYKDAVQLGFTEYKYINYISHATVDFSEYFTEGDYLIVSGAEDRLYNKDYNVRPYLEYGTGIKYAVIREISVSEDGGSTIYFYATNPKGRFVRYQSKKRGGMSAALGTFVPPMLHIAAFGKRIWGVDPKEDAVYSSVFDTPSKLMNTDSTLDNAMSWQTVIGTADRAVGVYGAVSELLVMKKNSLVRINGTNASSFAISGIFRNCGCVDIRSCASAAGVVYYLGSNGFYAYDGSQPVIISDKLSCSYSAAVGFSDGVKYYASAIRADDGTHEFLVYDIRKSVWHKWSDTPEMQGFVRHGDGIYACYNEGVAGVSEGEGAVNSVGQAVRLCGGGAYKSWECESVVHYESANTQKAVNELWLRMSTDNAVEVYTRVNDGEWVKHRSLEPKGRVFMYKVPVRLSPGDFWQYKLKSSGRTVIHNIERVYEEGGGRHYAY